MAEVRLSSRQSFSEMGSKMDKSLVVYEKKILQDREFPIQLLINRRIREGKTVFGTHWHEHIEMHYLMRGSMLFLLDGKEVAAKEGDLVIANSNVTHGGVSRDSEMETMVVIFELNALSEELADKNMFFSPLIRGDSVIREYMKAIHREYEKKEPGYRLACKGIVLQLIAYLARNYVQEMISDEESARRMRKLERLNVVKKYIADHYGEPITNGDLAALIHVSEDRFNHLFKESIGVSPLQYINEIRLKKAMNFLIKGEFTVTQAAAEAGFCDYNHFGRMFKKYYGYTPMEVYKAGSSKVPVAEKEKEKQTTATKNSG